MCKVERCATCHGLPAADPTPDSPGHPMAGSHNRSAVLATALILDLFAGDPPNRWHPVAWMGSLIGRMLRSAPGGGEALRFAYGLLIVCIGLALSTGMAALIQDRLRRLPPFLQIPIEAVLLKMTLSPAGLSRAANAVYAPLLRDDLEAARRALSWHLVSRATGELSRAEVAAAAVESVAENSSDGVIAPMFYYAWGGLPAAYGYRFLNTADSMLGYRDTGREWLGKAAARADDLANWIPARLTALLFVVATLWNDAATDRAWQIWRRDAGVTSSPNAGHPMSAMAGALAVELSKTGHYRLGHGARAAHAGDITRSVRLLWSATIACLLLCCAGFALLSRLRSAHTA